MSMSRIVTQRGKMTYYDYKIMPKKIQDDELHASGYWHASCNIPKIIQ